MARALVDIRACKIIFPFRAAALDVSAKPWLNVVVEPTARQPMGTWQMAKAEFLLNFRAIECESNIDAIQEANAGGFGEAIRLGGKPMVVRQADCDRLAAAGVGFAYLCDHEMPDGSFRIMTVPVN